MRWTLADILGSLGVVLVILWGIAQLGFLVIDVCLYIGEVIL